MCPLSNLSCDSHESCRLSLQSLSPPETTESANAPSLHSNEVCRYSLDPTCLVATKSESTQLHPSGSHRTYRYSHPPPVRHEAFGYSDTLPPLAAAKFANIAPHQSPLGNHELRKFFPQLSTRAARESADVLLNPLRPQRRDLQILHLALLPRSHEF